MFEFTSAISTSFTTTTSASSTCTPGFLSLCAAAQRSWRLKLGKPFVVLGRSPKCRKGEIGVELVHRCKPRDLGSAGRPRVGLLGDAGEEAGLTSSVAVPALAKKGLAKNGHGLRRRLK